MSAALHSLPPGLWLALAGLLLFAARPRLAQLLLVLAAPAATLWLLPSMAPTPFSIRFLSYDLLPVTVHAYSALFATAFALVALAGGIYAFASRVNRAELAAGYLSAGAATGIVYAGDVVTLFICWEALTAASLFLIWQGRREASGGAGLRYALVHLLGGMLLLGGITAQVAATDSLLLTSFHLNWDRLLWTSATYTSDIGASSLAIWLIFAGVAINAGIPPFSAWIADAYPESSPSGMVFLSSYATKAAVFILLTFFSGTELLAPLGLLMMLNGALLAMLESDLRRLLAHALLVQLGILLAVTALGTPNADQAVAIHAFNHLCYNALLVTVAGLVMQRTGKTSLTDLGGLARAMPFTCACAVLGTLSLAGAPFTGGYIGKSLLSSAIAASGAAALWYALTTAAALAMLYAGGRFLWFVFFQPPPSPPLSLSAPHFPMRAVLSALALAVLLPGLIPQLLLQKLADGGIPHFYDATHILAQLQLIIFSSAVFLFFLPLLRPTRTITLDTDWIYRRLLVRLVFGLEKLLALGYTAVMYANRWLMHGLTACLIRLTGPGGLFAETRTLANTTLIVAVLLAGYLLLYHYQS